MAVRSSWRQRQGRGCVSLLDETTRILRYRRLIDHYVRKNAEAAAYAQINAEKVDHHSRRAAEIIVLHKMHACASFAQVDPSQIAANPLGAIWSRVCAVVPRVLQKTWATPESVSIDEAKELRALSASTRLDGPLVERIIDEDRLAFVAGRNLVGEFTSACRLPLMFSFACAIPNEAALGAIARLHTPVVELGAGSGYWGAVLRARGVECILYDAAPPSLGMNSIYRHSFAPVSEGSAEVLKHHPGHALLLVWPCDPRALATAVPWDVHALACFDGDIVLHVGELKDDTARSSRVTSSPALFRRLQADFWCEQRIPLETWPLMSDELSVWKRRKIC